MYVRSYIAFQRGNGLSQRPITGQRPDGGVSISQRRHHQPREKPSRNICHMRDHLSRAFGMVTAAQPIVLFCRSAHKSRQVHDVVFHKQHRLGRMTALFAAATVPRQRVFFGKVLVHRCLGSIHCMFLPFCCAVATLIKRHSVLSALLWSHHQHRLKPHRPVLLN